MNTCNVIYLRWGSFTLTAFSHEYDGLCWSLCTIGLSEIWRQVWTDKYDHQKPHICMEVIQSNPGTWKRDQSDENTSPCITGPRATPKDGMIITVPYQATRTLNHLLARPTVHQHSRPFFGDLPVVRRRAHRRMIEFHIDQSWGSILIQSMVLATLKEAVVCAAVSVFVIAATGFENQERQ